MPAAPPVGSDALIDGVFGTGDAAAAEGGAELVARAGDGDGAGTGGAAAGGAAAGGAAAGGDGAGTGGAAAGGDGAGGAAAGGDGAGGVAARGHSAGPSTSDGGASGAGIRRLARSAPPSRRALARHDDSKRAEDEQREQEAREARLREQLGQQLLQISSAEDASRDALATFAAAAAAQEAHADFISAQMDYLVARRDSKVDQAALRWYSRAKAELKRGGAAPRLSLGAPQPSLAQPAWDAATSFYRRMPSVREKELEAAGKEGETAPKKEAADVTAAVTAAVAAAVSRRSLSRSGSGELAPDKKAAPPPKRSSSSLAKVSPSPDKAKAPRSAASPVATAPPPPPPSGSLGAGDGDGGSAALRRMASVREEEQDGPRGTTPPKKKAPCAVM